MSPAERAAAAYAAAELATHPRDKAALRSAASAWERLSRPGEPWSLAGERRDLRQLRIEVAIANGPFAPKQPPKAPPPARLQTVLEQPHPPEPIRRPQAATIEF